MGADVTHSKATTLICRIAVLAFSCLTLALSLAPAAQAQGSFSAVAEVGDRIVTGFELRQRMRLLEVQGGGTNLRTTALDQLINERLQQEAAERAGITATDAEVTAAIATIASRTNRSPDEFLRALSGEGVDPTTFIDQTRVGVIWRKTVQSQFRVTATDAEIENELGLAGGRGTLEFLFAEVFLPVNTPRNAEITRQLVPQIRELRSFDQFSEAARRVSVAPSKERGGVMKRWIPFNELPPQLRGLAMEMRPGQVTQAIDFNTAVGLFQLRGKREGRTGGKAGSVDFITFTIGGSANKSASAHAAEILPRIDNCLDIYGIAKEAGLEDQVTRETMSLGALPRSLALEIARLDAGESSTRLSADNGSSVTIISLCARLPGKADDEVDREAVGRAIVSRKLEANAAALLEELRGETLIIRK